MFTGLVHGQGKILAVHNHGAEMRLSVRSLFALENIQLGESIAINGVCLTVEKSAPNTFEAYASAETMQCTNLGLLRQGSQVNIERALAVGDRLGGHIVSGHVDCLGSVAFIEERGQSRCIGIDFPEEYSPEIIAKGSITLDGISLTVNEASAAFLAVNVIPETWSVTTVGLWSVGSKINMETDIIGKYVRHMLKPWQHTKSASAPKESSITESLLQKHGFL